MTLLTPTTYAALAEEVYQRSLSDAPLRLSDIFEQTPAAVPFANPDLDAAGLIAGSDGMIYSAKETGFAAQVLNVGGRVVVAFRGTDMATTWDWPDLDADQAIGGGSEIGLGQVNDLVNLMNLVVSQPGGAANVTVTGQSLGGGLAVLAGAFYGVQTYAFDTAPFGNELRTWAAVQAARYLNIESTIMAPSGYWNDLSIFRLPYEYQAQALSGKLTATQIDSFIALRDAYLQSWLTNISANSGLVSLFRVDHEILSAGNDNGLSGLIAWGATAFDSASLFAGTGLLPPFVGVMEAGKAGANDGTSGASIGSEIALHHPSLVALLLKDPGFGDLTRSDAMLRYDLWEKDIAGPKDHDRADPPIIPTAEGDVTITSAVQGGAPQTGVLYRALWLDDEFRFNFEQSFYDIESGTAGTGWTPGNTLSDYAVGTGIGVPTVHRSFVDLGLRVVRDGIHSDPDTGKLSIDAAARYVFKAISNNDDATPADGNYAVIRMADIRAQSADDQKLIDTDLVTLDNAFMRSLMTSGLYSPTGSIFMSLSPTGYMFSKPTLGWKVVAVQDGVDGASMHYAPTSEIADQSHLIIGGAGNDVIEDSWATDYIDGGAGNDTFVLGGYPEDGKGDYINGGSGYDTINYSNSSASINFIEHYGTIKPDTPDLFIASNNEIGTRHDVVGNVEAIIGPSDPTLTNYFYLYGLSSPYTGTLGPRNTIILNGGTNYVSGMDGMDLIIEGHGGFNVVQFALPYYAYVITPTASGWAIKSRHSPGVIDNNEIDISGVQAVYFGNGSGGTAGAPLVRAHYGENNGNGSLYAYPDQNVNPTSYSFLDTSGNRHRVDVEYYGMAKQHGTLVATIQEPTSIFGPNSNYNGYTEVQKPGTVALSYTPYAGAKYQANDVFSVTITNIDNGYKTTFYVNENSGGTLQAATASLDSTTPSAATVSEPLPLAPGGHASGTIDIVDSDPNGIETASFAFSSSSSGVPLGHFSVHVEQDANGHQHVAWTYDVDGAVFLSMAEGSAIQETYRVWVADQFGMRSAPKDVVVTLAAKQTATTQIVSADTTGVVVQGQDAYGYQVASGKILIADVDRKEMHSAVAKLTGGGFDAGSFTATVANDTNGTGYGEIAWQYVVKNPNVGSGSHSYDIAISDGRGGTIHQTVTITNYAFNPNATPILNAPGTLMAQSGATASETGTFMDANFAAHHTVSVTSLDQAGSDWGQLSATLLQDSSWPTPGMGSYTLTYAPSPSALDALQDGESHIEHWQVSLIGDNGKSASQTLTVVVGRPPNQTFVDPSASTVSGLLVADTHQTSTETAAGRVVFVDSITTDSHVLTATFLSSDGGSAPLGSLTAALGADTTGGAGPGHADWSYEAANSDLAAIEPGQVIHEVWQLAFDDGHGGTTLQNVIISLSKTPPNTAPIVTTTSTDVFAQVTEAAATTGSLAHDQVSGTIAFADADAGDAPSATVSSVTAVYLDAAGSPVDLTATQQATLASAFSISANPANGQSGTITWTFSPADADLDFMSRNELIQMRAVVTLDDGHGHTVDTPISIAVHGADDAPTVAVIDAGTVAETAAPVTIDLLQSSADPDRADSLHFGSVPTVTSSDGHIVVADISDHALTLDPQQFAYLGRNDQTILTIQFTASDGQMSSPGTATLVVTGANEAPQIAQQTAVQIDQNAGSTDIDLLASASDVDATDTLSLAANSVSVVANDGHQVQFTQSADGLLIDPSQFSYLAEGEQVSLTVNYAVTDGLASTAGQQTAVVTGTNDAPTVTPIAAGTISERAPIQSIDLLQGASDPDHGSTLSVVPESVKITSSDGHATVGTLTGSVLAIDPSDFLYLHQGQSVVLTVNYAVSDGITTTRNTATLTVTGMDSLPSITPFDVGSVDQNDPVKTIDLLQTASDPDGKDTLSVVGTPTVTEADGHYPMTGYQNGSVVSPLTHDVAFSYANGLLSIDPSQFAFLKAGQTDVVTISYDVTDGLTTLHNTATMTVVGETDLASPHFILSGTTPASGSYSFNGLTNVSSLDQGVTYQYKIVAGSVAANSSDGHAVAVGNTAGSSTITMDRSQFGYLGSGESTTVTLQYDVAIVGSSAPAIHTSAAVLVMGTDDRPIPTLPAIQVADTSAYDIYSGITGTLTAADSDLHDRQFWTPSNYIYVESTIVGNYGALLITPDGHYTLVPSSQKINTFGTGGTGVDQPSVMVDDGNGGQYSNTFNINYVGANDLPTSIYWANTGTTYSGGSVLEQTATGTLIGWLKDTDPDGGDVPTYSMIDNAGGRFSVSPTGQISVANGSLLSHADSAGYDIVVKVTDSAGASLQQSVHVTLLRMPVATIAGTASADTLTGTSGNDIITGLGGADTINGGAGDDLILPGAGVNHSDGGAGIDTISYVDSTAAINANLTTGNIVRGTYTDIATNFENIVATSYDDTIYGTSGANVIDAGAGNDKIYGRGGADVIDGGTGTDVVYFDDATTGLTVNLQTGAIGGAAAGVTLLNIEGVVGGSGNDTLTGLATVASTLSGGAGDDVLTGGSGADTFDGGTGHDTVYGSLGADTITDLDDLVLDYSASPSSVVLYSTGTYTYAGMGGYADGDTLTFGDAAHQGTAKLELHLSDYVDGVRLHPYDANTVYAGGGNDNIYVLDNANFAIQSKETIYGGDGYDIIHPGNDGFDFIDFGTGGGILDYQINNGYVNFHWAEPGGTGTVEVYSGTTATNIADHGQTLVTGYFESFEGSKLADTIFGNGQANFIFGNGGSDIIDAGGGDDHIAAVGTIHGGAGNDSIFITGTPTAGAGTANVYGDDGNDSILLGSNSATDIVIWGGAGDDVIDAWAGNASTIVHGGAGADTIRMTSFETLSYSDATAAIAISGVIGTAGDALGDNIIGTPKITGSNYGDAFENTAFELHLGTGNNVVINNSGTVYGNVGDDTIVGTSATVQTDTIHTGGGHDFLIGGAGNDQFYFDHPGSNDQATLQYAWGDGNDTIYGFTHGLDTINIARIAGDPDPTVTASVANGNTTVHIAWDGSHSANIVLSGVQLSSFIAGQDYHLV